MAISRRSFISFLLPWLTIIGLCASPSAPAQESAVPEEGAARTEAVAGPAEIPVSDIPARAESALALLRGITPRLVPSPRINSITEQVEATAAEIDRLSQASEMQRLDELSLRGLYGLKLRWQAIGGRLADWQQVVSARTTALSGFAEQLRSQQASWQMTMEASRERPIPEALAGQIKSVLAAIDELQKSLDERLDGLLIVVSRISDLSVQVANAVGAIREAEAANRGRLLVRDADPLWTALVSGKPAEGGAEETVPADLEDAQEVIGGELSATWYQQIEQVTAYLDENGDRVLAHLLVFAALVGLLLLVARRRARWPQLEVREEAVVDIVEHPFATAALVALLLSRSLYPGAPLALFDVTRLILVIPILVLLRSAFPDRQRATLFSLLGLFVLDVVRGLLQTQPLSGRLALLIVAALGLAIMIRSISVSRSVMVSVHGPWEQTARWFGRLSVLTLGGSIIANVVGIVALAELLGEATILSIFLGFGLFALSLVAMGLLDLFLQSPLGSRVRAFRRNPDLIHRRVGRLVNLVAMFTWLILILWFFKIWAPIWASIVWLFSTSLAIGAFEISLGDVFAFVVAIWLGIQVSRFIRFILNEDVFTRLTLPRGVPATISMMVNYSVVTIAFLIALAVAGFDLSRFAIIAGALSVGIGFGLQNVVNNFVSGLILAFERPISVGDSIEVGALWGRVRHIGIRSSIVRTFDGSEVIVPNADFISKEVINWTLSDVSRRLIVPVGVAYGSNPHQVLDLLVSVAKVHPEVMQEPEPFALFIGFGESSLDFELRAWCEFNEGMRIKTELNLGIHDALKEAGIEIPFPQRDLHLRSVDPEAGRALASRRTGPPVQQEKAPASGVQADTSAIPSEGE